MKRTLLLALVLTTIGATHGLSESGERTLVVRERHSADLLNGAFTFTVLKIRGYSIDVRIDGERRKLKIGRSFQPAGGDCTVLFEEISPETRIARFLTNCAR